MSKHVVQRSARVKVVGLTFVVLTVLLGVWYIVRPNPLRRAASRMVKALRDGDGETLLEATLLQERNCSSLDAKKLRLAWEMMIELRIKESKFVREDAATQTSNGVQASASIWYADKAGNPWSLLMIANQAEGGPKTAVLYSMLNAACMFDSQGHAVRTQTVDTMLAGIKRFRPKLEAIGIERIMVSPQSCQSWDELIAILEKQQTINEAAKASKG